MCADHEIGPPESTVFLLAPGESRSFLPKPTEGWLGAFGIHLVHNSAKLKIINLPKHYPVVKVRPFGLERTSGCLARPCGFAMATSAVHLSSGPLVGESTLTDQGNGGAADAK